VPECTTSTTAFLVSYTTRFSKFLRLEDNRRKRQLADVSPTLRDERLHLWQLFGYCASGRAPANAQESAILITLPPGACTAVVSGVSGTTGLDWSRYTSSSEHRT